MNRIDAPDPALSTPRRLWLAIEPLHAVTYFAPEANQAWEDAGGRGFWRGYFAMRAAPFGPVGSSVVTASFFNFQPAMVQHAVPAVWDMISPLAAIAARQSGAAAALRRALGRALDDAIVAQVVAALHEAVGATTLAGRPLFAVNAALRWPDDPVEALWHGLTCLREHRGDGHNAALVAAGLDGAEAHLLAGSLAAGQANATIRLEARGWTERDQRAARERLIGRGLLTTNGRRATDAGRDLHTDVEARTDAAAMAPYAHLGADRTAWLAGVLQPWATAVAQAGVVRYPNPMGLPPPPG